MTHSPDHIPDMPPPDMGDAAWVDVLQAMDQTYAELIDYQEQLEARNDELMTLRRFLSSVMGSISDFLVVIERDGTIVDASLSFCHALGLGKAQLSGHRIADFFAGPEGERLMQAIAQVFRLREDATIEVQMTTTGGVDPVEFRLSPRLDRRRKATGAVLTGRPLGELRRAYSELEDSHRALKDAQSQLVRNEKLASLGRLLAGVAHELNNPISFVYANAHALEKYAARFEEYFDRVQAGASRAELVQLRADLKLDRELKNLRSAISGARDGAERVRDIVEDLRRLSADGTGDMVVFDLVETARLAASWVERGSKSAVRVEYLGESPCRALGRPGHIQQVLLNLVQNAFDAMAGQDTAALTITAAYRGDRAELTVQDSGPGIPDDIAQTIFDPFFTTKEVGKGTGLGLSISHKIVDEHGGDLTLLDQSETSGAAFRVSLQRGEG